MHAAYIDTFPSWSKQIMVCTKDWFDVKIQTYSDRQYKVSVSKILTIEKFGVVTIIAAMEWIKVFSVDYVREAHSKGTLKRIVTCYIHHPGGRFKNTYELLNLRALKISKLHKNHIFQCMGKIFCVEFQRVPLKFHTKYLTHTLKDVDFIHIWKFKSSLI